MRSVVLAGVLSVCVPARALAQPAPPPSQPDFARATQLYDAATQAMNEGRAADAVRDFLAAYEITKDAVLFFKIGGAYEKAGNCADAIAYYDRYLNEAKPAESFATLTRERIAACKASPAGPTEPAAAAEPVAPVAKPPEAPPPPLSPPTANQDRAWLFVGGALTFVTIGAVLAYSTSSAEQDIKDLYVSNEGRPPKFEGKTRERYEDLLDEGRRYEVLAWSSFGLAAGCAIGATIFFLRDRGDVEIAPVVTPKETGVSATVRF